MQSMYFSTKLQQVSDSSDNQIYTCDIVLHQVSDKLREMLVSEASENAELYQSEEKQELLFCVFQHLCLGGAVNQFEVRQKAA